MYLHCTHTVRRTLWWLIDSTSYILPSSNRCCRSHLLECPLPHPEIDGLWWPMRAGGGGHFGRTTSTRPCAMRNCICAYRPSKLVYWILISMPCLPTLGYARHSPGLLQLLEYNGKRKCYKHSCAYMQRTSINPIIN